MMTGLDIESIEALDFDHETPCDGDGYTECSHAARWRMTMACCGEVWLMCTEHKDSVLAILRNYTHTTHNPAMGGCGASPVTFSSIEPIS